MTTTSRRGFLVLSGAALAALSACASAAPANPGIARIPVATPVGTFDALAAGPPDGRKVLLLHGFPEFAEEWDGQLRALAAAGYRAVAPDQRGYSPGVRPPGVAQYTVEHAVGDVAMIADSLGWQRFDLVGHDWGAVVGWVAAARYPTRVQTLTAVSVPHPAAFADALRADPEQQRKSRYMAMFRQPSPRAEDRILRSGAPRLPGVPAAKCADYFRRLSRPGALTAALNWYRANDFTGYRQPVAVPTLFVAGARDATVAAAGVRATRDWVRGPYRLVTLDAEHNIPEQCPNQVNRLLLDHLGRT